MALITAMTVTPTSANTAIHMVASPSAARSSTSNLTAMANTTFCRAMEMVRREMEMAVATFFGLSSMSTTSAASMAASEPSAPMAIPTSALANTGASLMPSPTKASEAFSSRRSRSCCMQSTFSSGSNCVWHSSMPSCRATSSPTSFRSPVSNTVWATPICRRLSTASLASSFTLSEMTM